MCFTVKYRSLTRSRFWDKERDPLRALLNQSRWDGKLDWQQDKPSLRGIVRCCRAFYSSKENFKSCWACLSFSQRTFKLCDIWHFFL